MARRCASALSSLYRSESEYGQAALTKLDFKSTRLISVSGPKSLLLPALVALLAGLSGLLALLARHRFLPLLLEVIALLLFGLFQSLLFICLFIGFRHVLLDQSKFNPP